MFPVRIYSPTFVSYYEPNLIIFNYLNKKLSQLILNQGRVLRMLRLNKDVI